MNKKAFVLMETIVVIVVISIALLTVFRSYNKILAKVKAENKYDTSEYIYMTKYIKDYLKDYLKNHPNSISADDITGEVNNLYENNESDEFSFKTAGLNYFNVKKIYILKNINNGNDEKFNKFDAYMIDYLRKLDVGDNDELIIVEYQREALDDKGNLKTDSRNKQLYEKYIASLEWE